MKAALKTLLCGAAIAALLPMASCSNDDEPKLPSDTPLYLQYHVDITDNGGTALPTVEAYANFRAYNANGQSVKLNNGADIRCNGYGMTYFNTGNSDAEWSYYTSVTDGLTFVKFEFTRSKNNTEVTTVKYDEVPVTPVPTGFNTVYPGQILNMEVDKMAVLSYEAYLMRRTATTPALYPMKSIGLGMFQVPTDVPLGSSYSIVLYTIRKMQIPKSNACAGGEVTATRSSQLTGVTVVQKPASDTTE